MSLIAGTAYEALRAVPGKVDPLIERRVVELIGVSGAPEPAEWTVVLEDPQARGGVRELEIQNTLLISQRTPVRRGLPTLTVLDLNLLTVDSPLAFQTANTRATAAGVGFYSADYRLIFDVISKRPVWVLTLKGKTNETVGEVVISADSGTVLRADFETYREKGAAPQPDSQSGFLDRTGRTMKKAGKTVEKSFLDVGRTLQKFFTGKETIGR